MSAIEIALHQTARPEVLPEVTGTTMRLRGWIAAHAIDLADMIAGMAQDNEPADAGRNPWARPVGLGRVR